jgi:hypothetical protein
MRTGLFGKSPAAYDNDVITSSNAAVAAKFLLKINVEHHVIKKKDNQPRLQNHDKDQKRAAKRGPQPPCCSCRSSKAAVQLT